MKKYIQVTSLEELKNLGYTVPSEWKEQIEIIFGEHSNLKFQTRINTETKGLHVGMLNKLVAFVE